MDAVLRIVTITLLLLTALGVMRHPHPWRWRVCFVLLAISLSAFVAQNSSSGILTPQGQWRSANAFVTSMTVLFAWWFVQCSFSDSFRFDAFRLGFGIVWLGAVIFSILRFKFGLYAPLAYIKPILVAGLMLHLTWDLLNGREDDLRLRRRDVRVWLPVAIVSLFLIDVGVDFSFGFHWQPKGFIFALNMAIFLVVSALIIPTTKSDLNVLSPSSSKKFTEGEAIEFSKTAQLIDNMMREEKLYLKPDLKLSDIVARLPVSEASTRKLIHAEFGCEHFRTFLNRYRIEHALSLLNSPKGRDLKLIAIAFDSGFASLVSFRRAFKVETGKTPSIWRGNN